MTREEALASLPEKFRKEAARNFSTVRAALKACANEVEAALALPADAPVRVSTPTLTRKEVLAVVTKLEAWADQLDKTPSPVEAQHVRACALLVRDALDRVAASPSLRKGDVI